MDENGVITNFAQDKALGGFVKEGDMLPGEQVGSPEKEAQDEVLQEGCQSGAPSDKAEDESPALTKTRLSACLTTRF